MVARKEFMKEAVNRMRGNIGRSWKPLRRNFPFNFQLFYSSRAIINFLPQVPSKLPSNSLTIHFYFFHNFLSATFQLFRLSHSEPRSEHMGNFVNLWKSLGIL